MKLKIAKEILAKAAVSIVRTKTGDYRVRLKEDVKPFDSDLGYFTSDIQDAVNTGIKMRANS